MKKSLSDQEKAEAVFARWSPPPENQPCDCGRNMSMVPIIWHDNQWMCTGCYGHKMVFRAWKDGRVVKRTAGL